MPVAQIEVILTTLWRALILWAAIITRLAARDREKEQN